MTCFSTKTSEECLTPTCPVEKNERDKHRVHNDSVYRSVEIKICWVSCSALMSSCGINEQAVWSENHQDRCHGAITDPPWMEDALPAVTGVSLTA